MYFLEINLNDFLIIALVILFIAAAWLIAQLLQLKKQIGGKSFTSQETIKLKLQAYERLTLYADRAAIKNIVPRLHQQNVTARDLQLALIQELNAEYEYNVSQQIYVSPELWQAITKLKDQNTFIINQIAGNIPHNASAIDLSRTLLEFASTNNADVSKIVLDALQFEAKKFM
jgi:type III secretory pathway component EscS